MALDDTNDPRGPKLLRRLETFLDVSYALLFVEMLRQLPRTEDFDPTSDAFGILRIFIDRPTDMKWLLTKILGGEGNAHEEDEPVTP
ncbi:MAG: hypothetical protein JRH11_00650 [Deltaproteobacteria bacterium]|nr:hypothetical protein [Deltaproteobacteria bacterium]